MALTTLQAAQAARDRITEQPESVAGYTLAKILAMIPYVVKDYGLEVARDSARRNYSQTDPAIVTASIVAGVADLSTIFSTSKVYEETFELAELYVANSGTPGRVRLVRSREQLSMTRSTEGNYVMAFWSGDKMYFRSLAGGTTDLTDTLLIQANKEPAADLSDLHARLEEDFIIYLAARAAAELGRGSATAQ